MTEQAKALRKTRATQFVPCPGTPTGCICGDLVRLYAQDKLPLWHGTISRMRLARLLRSPLNSLVQGSRTKRFAAARKCIDHFDHHLRRWGHTAYSQASDTHGVGRRGRRKKLALFATGSR